MDDDRIKKWKLTTLLLAGTILFAVDVRSADLKVTIHKSDGTPVADAVITLMPADGKPPHLTVPQGAVMDQVHSTFVPHVLVIPVGTPVRFPNSDNIHHDVYSFSAPKTFELPLYKGMPAQPVLFDKPGVVVLGCNIHDWMLGYIDVVTTPWFGKSADDGQVSLTGIPPGNYRLILWQPDLDAPDGKLERDVQLSDATMTSLDMTVNIVPALHSRTKP